MNSTLVCILRIISDSKFLFLTKMFMLCHVMACLFTLYFLSFVCFCLYVTLFCAVILTQDFWIFLVFWLEYILFSGSTFVYSKKWGLKQHVMPHFCPCYAYRPNLSNNLQFTTIFCFSEQSTYHSKGVALSPGAPFQPHYEHEL